MFLSFLYFCSRSYKSGSGVNNRRTELFLKEHDHLRKQVLLKKCILYSTYLFIHIYSKHFMVFIIVSALSMLIHLILLMILLGRNRIATVLTIIRNNMMLSDIQNMHSLLVTCNMSFIALMFVFFSESIAVILCPLLQITGNNNSNNIDTDLCLNGLIPLIYVKKLYKG